MFNISVGLYLVLNFKMHTYNYKRARLWNYICVIGSAVPSFWVFIDENIINDSSLSKIMMLINIFVLVIIGILL